MDNLLSTIRASNHTRQSSVPAARERRMLCLPPAGWQLPVRSSIRGLHGLRCSPHHRLRGHLHVPRQWEEPQGKGRPEMIRFTATFQRSTSSQQEERLRAAKSLCYTWNMSLKLVPFFEFAPQSCGCCTSATPSPSSWSRRGAWPPPALRGCWTSSRRGSTSGCPSWSAPPTTSTSTWPLSRSTSESSAASGRRDRQPHRQANAATQTCMQKALWTWSVSHLLHCQMINQEYVGFGRLFTQDSKLNHIEPYKRL